MIIKVKAATFIPAGTRCVTVTLDGHWRPATPGAIEFAYARPNIDAPYPAVEAGDEFWVQIKDQIVIVHNVHRLRTDGKPMCGQERLIIGDILTPHDKEVTCRACIDTCGCTGQGHKFVDGKCRACEQLEKHTHEYDGQGLCPCGADMQMGRPPVMEVAGGWSNEKSNANVDVLDDPKHEYSEECFCFSCKAFRQVGDEDFIKHLNAVTPLRGRIAMALWDFKKSRGHGMGEFGILDENAWESLAMADAVLAVMDKPVPYKDPCPPATSPNSDQPATPRCPEAAPDDKTGTCFCDGPGCQGDKAATELSNESVKRFGAFIAQKEAALTPAQARDLAVQIVDSIHRYTIEFAADQAKHSNEYDVAEQILLRVCAESGYGESPIAAHHKQAVKERDELKKIVHGFYGLVPQLYEAMGKPPISPDKKGPAIDYEVIRLAIQRIDRTADAVKDRDTALFALKKMVRLVGEFGSFEKRSGPYLNAIELLTALCPGCKGKYTENDKHTCVKEGD